LFSITKAIELGLGKRDLNLPDKTDERERKERDLRMSRGV